MSTYSDDPTELTLLLLASSPATALGQLVEATGAALALSAHGATAANMAAASLEAIGAIQGVTVLFAIDTVVEGAAEEEIYQAAPPAEEP